MINSNDIYDKIYNYFIDRNVAIKFAIITLFLTIKFEFKVVLPDFQQQTTRKTFFSQNKKNIYIYSFLNKFNFSNLSRNRQHKQQPYT